MSIRRKRAEEEKTVSITVDRDMHGPNTRPRAPEILHGPKYKVDANGRPVLDKNKQPIIEKPGETVTVTVKFANWAVWKSKAHFTTEADEAAAKSTGPMTAEDFVGKKVTR